MVIENRKQKIHFDVILPIFHQIKEFKIFYNANFYAESEFLNHFLQKQIFFKIFAFFCHFFPIQKSILESEKMTKKIEYLKKYFFHKK